MFEGASQSKGEEFLEKFFVKKTFLEECGFLRKKIKNWQKVTNLKLVDKLLVSILVTFYIKIKIYVTKIATICYNMYGRSIDYEYEWDYSYEYQQSS